MKINRHIQKKKKKKKKLIVETITKHQRHI